MTIVEPGHPRVVTIRHGATEWSESHRHTGRTDIPLTDEGRQQAAALRPRLAPRDWALVLTSPLSRAAQTCALAGLADQSVLDPDLLEWDYGDYEGLTSAQIQEDRPDWCLWTDGCPGGEQAADVAQRADRVIARCLAAPGDVAVFAHGHLLRVLGARWVGAAPAFGASLLLSTTGVSTLGWEHSTRVIESWNDTLTGGG